MIIIKDETKETFAINKCESCGKEKPARQVKAWGILTKESRGNYMLCFDCFGPRIFWSDKRNVVFSSPAK